MIQLTAALFRIALNQASRDNFVNKLSGGTSAIYKASAADFQCAVFKSEANEANFVDDLSNVANVRMCIFDKNEESAQLLAEKIIPAEELETCSWTSWSDNSGQQFTFSFSNEELNFAVPTSGSLYIEISMTLTDAGADLVPLATALVPFKPFRSADADPAGVVDGTAFSKAESDARYVRLDGSTSPLMIGNRARLVALDYGFKVQLSYDGETWEDSTSYILD